LASMGVYLFDWQILKKYLILDEGNPDSQNDFGKNIIPQMLDSGEKLQAYNFDGYWKDVGTAKSLWEANMDLVRTPPRFDLYDPDWTIFSRSSDEPPHFASESAHVSDSIVTEGCRIYGRVHESILFRGVTVSRGARIVSSVVFPGAYIEADANIENAIIGSGARVRRGADVRPEKQGEICVIGDESVVGMRMRSEEEKSAAIGGI